jgi:sugar lactone lactonase YvrE
LKTADFQLLPNARLLAQNLIFPECPRFHDGRIYIVDGPAVRRFDLVGNCETVVQLPTMMLLGLHIEQDGTIYTNDVFNRTVYRVRDGQAEIVADLSNVVTTPNNELVVLPGGEILVGNMGFNIVMGETPIASGLYRVGRDGSIVRTGPDIVFPNGMLLSDEGRTLDVVGSVHGQIFTLALNADGQVMSSDVLQLTAHDHAPHPDGIARASDGGLWYGDMQHGLAVLCNDDGSAQLAVKGAMNHISAVWLFETEGQEWLAMTGLMNQALPTSPDDFTARLTIAPVSEILAAAHNI